MDRTLCDSGLAQRDKNGVIGRLLYNLSESAFETKDFVPAVWFLSPKGRDQNIERPPPSNSSQKAKITFFQKIAVIKPKRQVHYQQVFGRTDLGLGVLIILKIDNTSVLTF